MSNRIEVVSVNVSEEKGTIKTPVPEIRLDERGVRGDAHAGAWHRQVSLLGLDSVERFSREAGRAIAPGEFAENLTLSGIDLNRVAILDRFQSGEVELEVTQIGKACHGDSCAIFREVGNCVMPKEGIFCRVLRGGTLRAGSEMEYSLRPLKIRVITLSDRAHGGEYSDRSGPKIRETLETFFQGKRWHPEYAYTLLPDEPDRLRSELEAAGKEGFDLVFTTGGTGVGPRDVAPEIVSAFCEKEIPGVMEAIRSRFGPQNPNAWLSRGVVGVTGSMLVYTLPGSVRAVEEYLSEILKTCEHLICMLHGLGHH